VPDVEELAEQLRRPVGDAGVRFEALRRYRRPGRAVAFVARSAGAGSYGVAMVLVPRRGRGQASSPAFRRYSPTLAKRALFFLSTERYQGDLDDVRIYKRALMAAEIQALAAGLE
jgi:hypothetical protein